MGNDYESQPLDMVAILCNVAPVVRRTFDALIEVGRSATLDQVHEQTLKRMNVRSPDYERFGLDRALKMLTRLGVLNFEDGVYTATDEAVDHVVGGLVFGCTDAQQATAPQWLRDISGVEDTEVRRG